MSPITTTSKPKAACPISRVEFRETAEPITVTIGGVPYIAEVKEFSTGSLGWCLNGKATFKLNGKAVTVQVGMNLTLVGSKELPA